MPMPSLFKYFAFVGAALLAVITLANFLLDPSTGASVVATPVKPAVVVQHDPRASKVERWRNEQAALKAASQTQTSENASLVTKSELAPPSAQQAGVIAPVKTAAPAQTQASAAPSAPAPTQPAAAAAAVPELQTIDVSAEHDAEAARAAELARAKAERVKAAKAAKAAREAKIARDRARAEQLAQGPQQGGQQGQSPFFGGPQQRTASNQQDQFYYGQRTPPREQGPSNAYAPRPTFGPFGGFGNRVW
jgi:hypothetical protein